MWCEACWGPGPVTGLVGLCWLEGLSVAGGHTAQVHQFVHALNDGGSSLLVAVGADASAVALSFDEPGEAGHGIVELGELHFCQLVLEHVIQDCESTCLPVLLQGRVPTRVGHQGIRSSQSVVLVLALLGS